ncbi:MAG TPA: hypothetical protein VGK29_19120 [Paludibaculum sp.]
MRTVPLFFLVCLLGQAEGASCTAKDFSGVYAFHAQATNVTNSAILTFAGSLTANGDGKITAWKDQAVTAANPIVPPEFKLVTDVLDRYEQARSLGAEIVYTVGRDCLIKINGTFLGPTGAPSPLVWAGALVAGGKGALLMNASAQSPYISLVTVKRAAKKAKEE